MSYEQVVEQLKELPDEYLIMVSEYINSINKDRVKKISNKENIRDFLNAGGKFNLDDEYFRKTREASLI